MIGLFQCGAVGLVFPVVNNYESRLYLGQTFEFTTAATTPLPLTGLILYSGFVSLGFFAYRGTKKSSAAVAAA